MMGKVNDLDVYNSSKDYFQSKIGSRPIVVFAIQGCRYCEKAVEFFERHWKNLFVAYYLERQNDTQGISEYELRQYLTQYTNVKILPSVWIGGKYIGGYDDLMRFYNEGKLPEMVARAEQMAHNVLNNSRNVAT